MTPLQLQSRATDRGFERLYRRHAPDVYRYALAVLRNPDDAEDVTQTTFMNAYRAFQNGERPKAPKNWLIAIAHNVCRHRFRLASRRPSEVEFDEELTAAVPSDDGPSAGDIRRALGHLAFNQRAALVMRELEGRSYVEIASILGLSVSAVETLIFRARRALREQLEEALTCDEAEFAISRQLDGRLPRAEKGRLRAHLRACDDCAAVARSQRAQRSALRGLGGIPLPSSIASFFGGGGGAAGVGAAGMGVAAKIALLGTTAIVAAGVGYEGVHHKFWHHVVPRGHVAQAGRPVSGSVARPTTKIISDLRPPSDVAPGKRAATAHHAVAKATLMPVSRATRAVVAAPKAAQPVHKTPLAARATSRPKPRPAAAAHVAKQKAKPKPKAAPVVTPTPPAAPPPAAPPPPATPAPAPVPTPAVTERSKHRHHRHHHAAPRRKHAHEDDDDASPAPAAVVPPKPHKHCKPHRHEHKKAEAEAKVVVKVREHHHHHRAAPPPPPPPAQPAARHERDRSDEHRDHHHHHRAAPPPPPPAQPAARHERDRSDEHRDHDGDHHERDDRDGGHHGGAKRQP